MSLSHSEENVNPENALSAQKLHLPQRDDDRNLGSIERVEITRQSEQCCGR
jgi:hypothetical protein